MRRSGHSTTASHSTHSRPVSGCSHSVNQLSSLSLPCVLPLSLSLYLRRRFSVLQLHILLIFIVTATDATRAYPAPASDAFCAKQTESINSRTRKKNQSVLLCNDDVDCNDLMNHTPSNTTNYQSKNCQPTEV